MKLLLILLLLAVPHFVLAQGRKPTKKNPSVAGVASFICCSTNVWNGIVPLKSTKADVEKQLGKPMGNPNPGYGIADYKYKNGTVTIVYAVTGCRAGFDDYDVPMDTVVRISDYPEPLPSFSEFKLDRNRFVEGGHPDGPSPPFFVNRHDGISVWLDKDEKRVRLIDYFPGANDDRLRCK